MSSLRETILSILQDDAVLQTVLTGGVYAEPLDRKKTPDAFGTAGKMKPAAVLTLETTAPFGPEGCERVFFSLWCYQDRGYTQIDAAISRIKALLHRRSHDAVGETGMVFEFRHAEDSGDQLAPELNNVALRFSRFSAVLHG